MFRHRHRHRSIQIEQHRNEYSMLNVSIEHRECVSVPVVWDHKKEGGSISTEEIDDGDPMSFRSCSLSNSDGILFCLPAFNS